MSLRAFLISLLLLSIPFLGKAQQRFEGKLIGGFVLAQIDGDRLAGYNKIGLQGGLGVKTILNERWSLGLEFLYTQQGSSRTLNDPSGAAFEKIRLNLVEAPVLLYFADWKFEVGAGISYGRVINFEAIDVFGEDVSNTQDFRENIFSFNADLLFNFSEQLALGIRWSKYLNNLQADPASGTFLGKQIAIRGLFKL